MADTGGDARERVVSLGDPAEVLAEIERRGMEVLTGRLAQFGVTLSEEKRELAQAALTTGVEVTLGYLHEHGGPVAAP